MPLSAVAPDDLPALRVFLREADLTLAGLEGPAIRLWIDREEGGRILGSTGFESSSDGAHALIRSVAVSAGRREAGAGSRLAQHAMDEAAAAGATRAWLFSRRSSPFRQKLGFEPADRLALAEVLAETHQVRLFTATGQLEREVAWSRRLRGEVTSRAHHPSR